ncbi:endonuclease domain-containing protein [Patescibacteria group bacterium]|nr:endonuclease domain-containing protein [Patescibacteria group bacterium]MBU1705236.1 endonuclease domain-containing protein [Patescibacteria group bacterium]
MKIFNLRKQKEFRKKLRNEPTEPEKILWKEISNKKLNGFKFRRQHGIGDYIADFYCPEAKLVIELDGDSHFEESGIQHDKIRTQQIEQNQIKIIRFNNTDIRDSIEGVIDTIRQHLNDH